MNDAWRTARAQADRIADPDTRLTGRTRELAYLTEIVDALAAGPPTAQARIIAVSGEPGIGKTSLLRKFGDVATGAGRLVLWGRATEFERQVPFGIFTDALDDFLRTVDGARLAPLGTDRIALLRTIFPALSVGHDAAEAYELMGLERYRLYRAVRALLELVAGPDGMVLVLDDMHWADDGSIELCEHLLRRPPQARLAIALAYRPRQVAPRLAAALTAAAGQAFAAPVEIGPLSFDEAQPLLNSELGRSERRRLYEASGGNPFYLDALGRIGGTGAADGGIDPGGDAPAPVRAALSAELVALSQADSVVAHAAAVVGDTFEPDVVAEVAQTEVPSVLTAIDELVRRDLIRPVNGYGRFEFRHPLVRNAAYRASGAGWRVAAHSRAAAALRARGAAAVLRAHHVELASGRGDEGAIDVLVEAATATINVAPATAAHWLRAALDLLPDEPERAAQRLGLLGMLSRALGVTGRLRESRDVIHEVLLLLPTELAEVRAQTVGFAAMIERLLGRHAEARALLLAELERLADPSGAAAAMIKLELASARMMGGQFTEDRDWADEAVAIARWVRDKPLLAASLGMWLASTRLDGTGRGKRLAYLQEAAGLIDALPDGELARHLDATVWVGWAELFADQTGDAIRHLERGLRLARETGQNHMVTYLLTGQCTAYALMGRLTRALESADDSLEAAYATGSDELRTMALSNLCWINAWMGEIDEAVRLGKEAVAAAGPVKDWYSGVANAMLAQARLYAGDARGCVELITSAGGGPDLPDLDPMSRASWYQLLAYADAQRGDVAQARAWAERAENSAAESQLLSRRGIAQLGQGHAALPVDPAKAVEYADAAAAMLEPGGNAVDVGRAHLLAGTALSALGESDLARCRFAQARAIFEQCGAGLFLRQAAREERRMNARLPRRRTGGATDAGQAELTELTARERDIAMLVAKGLTNRQIADQLYLSPKTVEVHVSRVFAKLGVATRTALAHAVNRRDRD